jgi:LPXTG-site transpeptidase (sortase) family protein
MGASVRKLTKLIVVVAVLLIAFGVVQLALRVSKTTGSAPPPNPRQTVTVDTDTPIEKKATAAEYIVPADQPRMIHLPTISASGPIQKVGLNKSNAIAVPTNVHFAGWYTGSAKPGYPGLSVIDGHVSGKYSAGIFKQLPKLEKGSEFSIEYGDGSRRTFAVVDGRTLPEKDAAGYLLQKRSTIDRQLNLITCDGVYDRQTKQYDKRYIIVAKAIDES